MAQSVPEPSPWSWAAARAPSSRRPPEPSCGRASADWRRPVATESAHRPGPRNPSLHRHLWLAALALVFTSACRRAETAPEQDSQPPAQAGDETASPPEPAHTSKLSLLDISGRCDLFQQGLVLDLGSADVERSRSFRLKDSEPLARVPHQGRSYARLRDTQTKFLVWLPAPIENPEFSAQVYGGTSQRIAAYLDDQRLGAASLTADKTDVIRIRSSSKTIEPGLHELVVSLSRRSGQDPGADVSWVRLGPGGASPAEMPAARNQVFGEMPLGSSQERAVILRHGALVSCPVWIPDQGTFKTALGVWGGGGAVANVFVHTAGGSKTSLRQVRIEPEDAKKGWIPLELDLSSYAGRAVELQLSAERVDEGSRLGFAQPTVEGKSRPGAARQHVRQVIVFLLSGLGQQHEAASASANGLPVVGALTRTSEDFSAYRAPSPSVTSVVASLLSGRQPWQHGLAGEEHTLDPGITGLAEAFQAAGGRAAFFTGVPLSFEGFGFSRGFEKFVSISPVEDRAATAPIDEAETWLTHHQKDDRPRLVFIHLRGGHPPFDIDRDAARTLPPPEYGGDVDARRAAIQLAEIRSRMASRQRMPEEDWTRLLALQKAALLKQDARIASFLAWLSQTNQDQDSLLVLMGDVAAGERPEIPFALHGALREDVLQTLLLVRHPQGLHGGETSPLPVTTVDVSATIAGYLGIELPGLSNEALDLGGEATRYQAEMRAQVAYEDGRYATRLGPFLLSGRDGKPPALCQLSLDPGCVLDRAHDQPIATRALWTSTWLDLGPALSALPTPTLRVQEPRLEAALTVWGVQR